VKITYNQDIYDNVDVIIKQLKEIGENDWAFSLSEALQISYMPGEILGELRFELTKFRETHVIKPLSIKDDVNELLRCIDEPYRSTISLRI
jgi:hypothetical protein